MKHTKIVTALAATTLFSSLSSVPVNAQEANNEVDAAIEQVVVTGSRIRSANAESVSPITTVDAEEFLSRGVIRTEDLVNALPQVFAAQGSSASNEATGTAQVDLRGLSADRTLVLVNGRRLPYGSPISVPSDLNQIPSSLIKCLFGTKAVISSLKTIVAPLSLESEIEEL